ncbi:MAG: family 20 glycosylhydrolase [Bacteroidales bacterium]
MKVFSCVKILIFVIVSSCIYLMTGCSDSAGLDQGQSGKLKVTWELLGNSMGGKEQCRTAFTFINDGNSPIGNQEWVMYFNQATIMPMAMLDSTKGKVEHINGDFYRFIPGGTFMLPPGDTLVLEYGYEGIMLKEADAPNGIYFVLHENTGQQLIVPVKNYRVKPFTEIDKLFSDPRFKETIPTPGNEYTRNLAIIPMPLDKVGKIIPTPVESHTGTGSVGLSGSTIIYFSKGLEQEAEYLTTYIENLTGIKLTKKEGVGKGPESIVLKTSDVMVNGTREEAYRLRINQKEGIRITGGDAAGVFYGIQSMLALLPVSAFSKPVASLGINSIEIADAPRFHFRGFLLDVSRNFQKKEAVLKLIDLLASYKINHLNFRITEDEGWRIEIKGLPELTQVGGKRGHTLDDKGWLPPSFGSGPSPDAEDNHGTGYYLRDDFKEILTYASQRHIKIVPEICFPSHARAAIKSMEARYRSFIGRGDKKAAEEFRLIDPDDHSIYSSAQLYKDNIACVALESTYHFYETVVQDIKEMYNEAGVEFTLLHTGGDEVALGAWAKSPECQKLLKSHPEITNPRNLQALFFNRLLGILAKYNLKIGGWEEVALNKDSAGNVTVNQEFVGKNVIPYVWDNTGNNIDLGYRIANAGYPVVLCNVTNLYFDLSYNTDPREPGLYWGGFQDARDPFVLIPFDAFKSAVYDQYGQVGGKEDLYPSLERLKPENRKNILGLQAQLWTETVKGQEMMEYYVLPKLFAFAEKAWAAAPLWESDPDMESRIRRIDTDWNEFANRIGQREFPRLDHLFGGFKYRIPPPGAIIDNGMLKANIAYPGLTIRYTVDGSLPTIDSPVYTGPVSIKGTVKLRAFSASGRPGRSIELK